MALTKKDLQAIRSIVRQEVNEETEPRFQVIEKEIGSLRKEARAKFRAIDKRFDTLDKAMENVAQELVNFAGELHKDHEVRISRIEQQIRS